MRFIPGMPDFNRSAVFSLGACALCLLLLAGCARNYVITLNNGSQIRTATKPRLQNGVYVFKDGLGRDSYVPAGRVTEVAPASMVEDKTDRFKAVPAK